MPTTTNITIGHLLLESKRRGLRRGRGEETPPKEQVASRPLAEKPDDTKGNIWREAARVNERLAIK
jgi:hypothetical protein